MDKQINLFSVRLLFIDIILYSSMKATIVFDSLLVASIVLIWIDLVICMVAGYYSGLRFLSYSVIDQLIS